MKGSEGTEIPTTDIRLFLHFFFLTRMHMFVKFLLLIMFHWNQTKKSQNLKHHPKQAGFLCVCVHVRLRSDSHLKFTDLGRKWGQTIWGWFSYALSKATSHLFREILVIHHVFWRHFKTPLSHRDFSVWLSWNQRSLTPCSLNCGSIIHKLPVKILPKWLCLVL